MLDGAPDVTGELGLGQFFLGLGQSQICEHVAAALRHRDPVSMLRALPPMAPARNRKVCRNSSAT